MAVVVVGAEEAAALLVFLVLLPVALMEYGVGSAVAPRTCESLLVVALLTAVREEAVILLVAIKLDPVRLPILVVESVAALCGPVMPRSATGL